MRIVAPSYCRPAWVRHLRAQGATLAEIAGVLGMSALEVARLASRSTHKPATSNVPKRLTR